MLKRFIAQLAAGSSLSEEEASEAMRCIVSGSVPPAQIGAYLVALRMKGESVPEILGSARVVREGTTLVPVEGRGLLDTCGTGGDGSSSFNVSTAAALVCAGARLRVAKHGNRSISSRCGSADLLEACGVRLDLSAIEAAALLKEAGIAFLFAPAFNGAMAAVAPVRRELGLRTVFNLLGPLVNPARASHQLLGVYESRWVEPLAEVLGGLGADRALVVHGMEGLDEISVSGPTKAALLEDGRVVARTLHPGSFGVKSHPHGAISGGDPAENKLRLFAILDREAGPWRDAVVVNAAAALWIGGAAADPLEGARLAEQTIDSGRAREALERLVTVSQRLARERTTGA